MSLEDFLDSVVRDSSLHMRIAHRRYIPPLQALYADLELDERLRAALFDIGVKRFYSHQQEAISRIRNAENTVVMTPTGSGKSLVYNIPVIEAILNDPDSRALYIFPLKGLEQDQRNNLEELSSRLGILNCSAVYDGDTTAYRRRKIRQSLPNVIFTNPDMLHYALNAFHPKWEDFFRNLRFVVIDEIHAYRGVFGSNVSQVLRRLRRISHRWGSSPQFIACSATIANPGGLAQALTGLPFSTVDKSGSPHAGVHFVFAEPHDSPYTSATRLFAKCLSEDLRTIAFTKARIITELIYSWTIQLSPELEGSVSPYRAGFLPSERREIEGRLFSGELKGVVSTSALELGVDIGGLDVCLLVGYPGSIASTWQRAGRVGRRGNDSLVVMIALQDAMDMYFLRHPEEFFGRSHEAAMIDPLNSKILKAHLTCAAKEVFLRKDDEVYDFQAIGHIAEELEAEGTLRRGKTGDTWFSGLRLPHREVGIRSIGHSFVIYEEGGTRIGEIGGLRVLREAFPGAVYLHMGRQFVVTSLDLEDKKIFVREGDVNYYTQALSSEQTEVLEERSAKSLPGFDLCKGTLRIRHQVVGYEKKGFLDRRTIGRHELRMPEYKFETEGLWIKIGEGLVRDTEAEGFDLGGALHAFEHAAISCIPLFALCDKNDIGGLSYLMYPDFRRSAVFIYDGHEGGVGLSSHVYDVPGEWFRVTHSVIRDCPCLEGCPSCVQDSMCGSGNRPLDKAGAEYLAMRLSEEFS